MLDVHADELWQRVTDLLGVNAELMPLLRMTAPRGQRRLALDTVQPGQRLCRSWLLLFGVLPIDYDDIHVAEVGPGYRFLERSRMLSAVVWEHERSVEEAGAGRARLTDRVRFTPRWGVVAPLLRWFVPRVFAHRHRRLRAALGGCGETRS
ncbi:hypothetical protein GCM10027194_23850 [Thalassiella azotivora]